MTTTHRIPAEDVKPGTVIEFLGTPHLITAIEPRNPVPAWEAEGIWILGTAVAAGDFRITLLAGTSVEVAA